MPGTIKFSNIDTVFGTKGHSAIHAFSRDSENRLIYERRILGRGDTIKLTDDMNVELYNQYYIRPSDIEYHINNNGELVIRYNTAAVKASAVSITSTGGEAVESNFRTKVFAPDT